MFNPADRLEQLIVEETFSEREVNSLIIKDLLDLEEDIIPLFSNVNEYLDSDSYYQGKYERIAHIRYIPVEELVERVLIACVIKPTQTIQEVVGKILPFLEYDNTRHGLTTATELIGVCSSTGLYSFELPRDSDTGSGKIVSNVTLEPSTYTRIQQSMYLPPMIDIPCKVYTNNESGYLLGSNESILLNGSHHDEPIALDVINKTAGMQFTVDEEAIKYQEPIPDFRAKALKEGKTLTEIQVKEATDNFLQQRNISDFIEKSLIGKPFYFTSKYDSRGRLYTQGYHVAIQSTDYKKSVVSLFNTELILDSEIDWLLIDIANQMGLDKLVWDKRIEWVQLHREELESLSEAAESPFMYLKAVRALRDYECGKASGHLVALDATASFLQIFAVLSGCEGCAEQSNLTNSDSRQDFYTNLTKEMQKHLKDKLKYSRKEIKEVAMPHFYGSKLKPKLLFGEDTPEYDAFYTALYKLVPGAEIIANVIEGCWDTDALYHQWVLPDDHTARVPVYVSKEYKGIKAPDEDVPFSFTYLCKENSPSNNSNPIKANFIQSFDAYIVRELIRRCDFEVLTIHDSFHCHVNNINKLREVYRQVLVDIASTDTLNKTLKGLDCSIDLSGITGKGLVQGIKEAEYFLS